MLLLDRGADVEAKGRVSPATRMPLRGWTARGRSGAAANRDGDGDGDMSGRMSQGGLQEVAPVSCSEEGLWSLRARGAAGWQHSADEGGSRWSQ